MWILVTQRMESSALPLSLLGATGGGGAGNGHVGFMPLSRVINMKEKAGTREHACSASTSKAEAGEVMNIRLAWAIVTLSWKKKNPRNEQGLSG